MWWLKRWISTYVSWEESQTKILRDTLTFRKKVKITYRQEHDTREGARGVGRKEKTYFLHFQSYSLMTRTPRANSQDLTQWFIILVSPWSLVSTIFLCDGKKPLQTHQLPSVFLSYLELRKSAEATSFLPLPCCESTLSICLVCPHQASHVRDMHGPSDLRWLWALNYYLQDPALQLPAVALAWAFTSHSILKQWLYFNILYVLVMKIRREGNMFLKIFSGPAKWHVG